MAASPLHTGRLVLTPQDPHLTPERPADLIQHLQAIGFAAQQIGNGSRAYMLGDRFIKLLTFMGCSPAIQLQPGTSGEPFCHLVESGPYKEPQFLSGRNTTPPRCGQCRKRLPEWYEIMRDWKQNPLHFQATCPHCQHQQNPVSYNWRQSAGCGCYMLLVENIFPQEAIPSAELLRELQTTTAKQPWHYFYIQD
ncbi:hypothetical protein [Candidatus Thiodiazotropha sp. CDECU1]|uniref:hypothetical protein n=1 Tax=Candidatus Thiodiazotropha sp. CDECU1 TaxID=3065865 RepID=UPI00292D50DD|nr:hypothetical protein [Candidatus Thiodiazotropha sp. CDECU1]